MSPQTHMDLSPRPPSKPFFHQFNEISFWKISRPNFSHFSSALRTVFFRKFSQKKNPRWRHITGQGNNRQLFYFEFSIFFCFCTTARNTQKKEGKKNGKFMWKRIFFFFCFFCHNWGWFFITVGRLFFLLPFFENLVRPFFAVVLSLFFLWEMVVCWRFCCLLTLSKSLNIDVYEKFLCELDEILTGGAFEVALDSFEGQVDKIWADGAFEMELESFKGQLDSFSSQKGSIMHLWGPISLQKIPSLVTCPQI